MQSFSGMNVLVTGGALGIGRLMALAFAERGATLLVADKNGEGAHKVARELAARGSRAFAYAVDVTDADGVTELASQIHADVGEVSVVVNNAGIVFGGPFEQVPIDKHIATYRVNVEGLVRVTHAFFPDLLRAPRAHLVNVASASGFIGLPNGSTYASSKWAVIGFSESIRLELLERGAGHVAVTTVCPSYIGTGMFDGVKTPLLLPLLTPEGIVEKVMQGVEQGAPFVKEPFAVKTLDAMKGLLPQRAFDLGAKLLGVSTSMNAWKGRGH
jgi:NAD(P)-dependent dehydrogenase (short-subunit alcohol dehydrogenase family)